jgi:hypothetical protein
MLPTQLSTRVGGHLVLQACREIHGCGGTQKPHHTQEEDIGDIFHLIFAKNKRAPIPPALSASLFPLFLLSGSRASLRKRNDGVKSSERERKNRKAYDSFQALNKQQLNVICAKDKVMLLTPFHWIQHET